ncbi:hypothetical protein ACLI4R_01775 [Natrialbaceae archaeon A-chndr2]
MGPIDLYYMTTGSGEPLTAYEELLTLYEGLSLVEQGVLHGAGVLLVGVLLIGILREFASDTLKTSHRSPFISLCIGLPVTIVLGGLFYTGLVLSGTNVGIFFAIPLVTISGLLLPAVVTMGYVSLGGAVLGRLGSTNALSWIVLGAALSALTVLATPVAVAVSFLAAVLGCGAGARVMFNGGGVRGSTDRVVPPANKI